ncbi:MAG: hypothetical protein IJU47_02310 [Verrucomicrobia bacterium]|nr:hypothetical protein [Verrucomicrobiota bacterium]
MSTGKNRQSNKRKTTSETKNALTEAIKNIDTLYKAGCINWSGTTSDVPNKPYVEVISEEILNSSFFDEQIKESNRETFYTSNHDGEIKAITNRGEEILAKGLYLSKVQGLGTFFDYQIPLKEQKKKNESDNEKRERENFNKGTGKIDLVSISDNDENIYLIELKAAGSHETLLRCGLEIYTYYKQLNFKTFKVDINKKYSEHFKRNNDLSERLKNFSGEFKKAVLIFAGSTPANMATSGNYHKTMELMKKLNVEIFIYPKEVEYKLTANLGDKFEHFV